MDVTSQSAQQVLLKNYGLFAPETGHSNYQIAGSQYHIGAIL